MNNFTPASASEEDDDDQCEADLSRHVEWATVTLAKALQKIFARRDAAEATGGDQGQEEDTSIEPETTSCIRKDASTILEEATDSLPILEFDAQVAIAQKDPNSYVIPKLVLEQLRDYVSTIANMYPDHAYHNFAHASHVAQSVAKFLLRIVTPTLTNFPTCQHGGGKAAVIAILHDVHETTYGIALDPLIQFAGIFSAIIHDVFHPGIPNGQLAKENPELARRYKGTSIAKQKSFDVAWDLLFQDQFRELRAAICATKAELCRFRQLVINMIMATDVLERSIKLVRNQHSDDDAFREEKQENTIAKNNRKATIVLEYMMEASAVIHTMQHWDVYREWNECLFQECHKGYLEGRGGSLDPSDDWFEGELDLLDSYIIPLSRKLKSIGLFGASGEECLTHAQKNRQEWVECGQDIVTEMTYDAESDRHPVEI